MSKIDFVKDLAEFCSQREKKVLYTHKTFMLGTTRKHIFTVTVRSLGTKDKEEQGEAQTTQKEAQQSAAEKMYKRLAKIEDDKMAILEKKKKEKLEKEKFLVKEENENEKKDDETSDEIDFCEDLSKQFRSKTDALKPRKPTKNADIFLEQDLQPWQYQTFEWPSTEFTECSLNFATKIAEINKTSKEKVIYVSSELDFTKLCCDNSQEFEAKIFGQLLFYSGYFESLAKGQVFAAMNFKISKNWEDRLEINAVDGSKILLGRLYLREAFQNLPVGSSLSLIIFAKKPKEN